MSQRLGAEQRPPTRHTHEELRRWERTLWMRLVSWNNWWLDMGTYCDGWDPFVAHTFPG